MLRTPSLGTPSRPPARAAWGGGRASSRRLPLRHDQRAAVDRVGDTTAQPATEECAVAALRRERSLDDPLLVRIEHHQVRRSPGFDRAAVIGRAPDPRGDGGEDVYA